MTKDKRYHLIILGQALLITLAFHLLLFVGFGTATEKQVEETLAYRRISLLPTSGNGELAPARIRPWMEFNDPTLIAKPNERFGYGNLLAVHGWRENLEASGPEAQIRRPAFAVAGWHGAAATSGTDMVFGNWLAPWQRYPVRPPSTADLAYPRVYNQVGKEVLRGVFESRNPEVSAELKRLPPVTCTVLQVEDSGSSERLPRYSVRTSCGNRQLDQLALRTIMDQSSGSNNGESTVTVAWPYVKEVR